MCQYEYKQLILVTLGFILKVQRFEVQACTRIERVDGGSGFGSKSVRSYVRTSHWLTCSISRTERVQRVRLHVAVHASRPQVSLRLLWPVSVFMLQREEQEVSFPHFA